MCVPAILPALSGAGAALTGTTAAAGTAAAAANAQLAIKGIQAAGQAIGALGAASERNKAVARNAQSAKDAYFVKLNKLIAEYSKNKFKPHNKSKMQT